MGIEVRYVFIVDTLYGVRSTDLLVLLGDWKKVL